MTRPNDEPCRSGRRVHRALAAGAIFAATLALTSSGYAAQKHPKKAAAPKPVAVAASTILPEHKPPVPAERVAGAPQAAPSPQPESAASLQTVTVTAPASSLTAREKQIFNEAVKAAAKRNWSKALSTVATAHNPLL